jgi:hypothetical protein
MSDNTACRALADAPVGIRTALLAARPDLPAGAIVVAGRFFAALAKRGENISAPSRRTFELACASESTLALLLWVLGRYAPAVCLAEGRALRRDYYRKRSGGSSGPNKSGGQSETASGPVPLDWPEAWLQLLPRLRAAAIKPSSLRHHISSVNRCAAMLPGLTCPPRLGWLLGWELAKHLQSGGVNARTAASYIGALVSLGMHGGLDKPSLDGLRAVQANLQRQGRLLAKGKQLRLEILYGRGGYAEILRVIASELVRAEALPDWRADAAQARATAAILAVTVNMPARTGDVASWQLGQEIVREPWGEWRLCWRQQKTAARQDAGTLWPEVAQVLDDHLLGGRPAHHAHRRYDELRGCNWLSLTRECFSRKWPSNRVRAAIGVPLHDLRTLTADYLRLHDPVTAPGIVAALLGHSTSAAGAEYRALSTDAAAQREWLKIRSDHADRRS